MAVTWKKRRGAEQQISRSPHSGPLFRVETAAMPDRIPAPTIFIRIDGNSVRYYVESQWRHYSLRLQQLTPPYCKSVVFFTTRLT